MFYAVFASLSSSGKVQKNIVAGVATPALVASLVRYDIVFCGAVGISIRGFFQMRVVFISGPYRAQTEYQVVENIREAEQLALLVWKRGGAVICPHKNTAFFGGAADDSVWLSGDLEILRRCDAVLCTPRWKDSIGACGEVEEAKRNGIPVFYSIEEIDACDFLNIHR